MELELSRELRKSPPMIRFYAERMMLELSMGRPLTAEERQHLSGKVSRSFPTTSRA